MEFASSLFLFLVIFQSVPLQQLFKLTSCTCELSTVGNGEVRILTLKCGIPVEDEIKQCFARYNNATDLVFTNSSLTTIPNDLNILQQLSTVDFSYNKIKQLDFQDNEDICHNIKSLAVSFNHIRTLYKGDLDCFTSLEHLHMRNNTLSIIENGTFNTNLKNLGNIQLIYNDLTSIDSTWMILLKLKDNIAVTLNVSWNKINNITNAMNASIDEIKKNNELEVHAIHNNITGVDIPYLFKLFHVTNPFQLFRNSYGLDVRFNPFICDCKLYPLAKTLNTITHLDPNNPVFDLTCHDPVPLRGMLVYQVPHNQFNCTVSKQCPHGCLCTVTVAVGLVTVGCSEDYLLNTLPENVPLSANIVLSIKTDKLHTISRKDYLINVTLLDVSQCGVNDIQTDILSQLDNITVYLHDNALQTLPIEIQAINFTKIHILTLHGNPFTCDCHTLWLKHWLLNNGTHVPHLDKVLCGSGLGKGKILVDVDDGDFVCTVTLTTKEIILIAAASVLFVAIVIIVVHRNSTNIQVLLIAYFNIYCFRKTVLTELKYDIFVSHSSMDDDVVYSKIIPKLENNNPPFKMCIDAINFVPGETIVNNIISAVESSLTTLLVISNSFLRSNWCMIEFREAHLRFMRDRTVNNIIIIVLEELDVSLIDKELTRYMRDHVYLKYTDKYFWPKLFNALPVRAKPGTEHVQNMPCTEPVRNKPCTETVRNKPGTNNVRDQPGSNPVRDEPVPEPVRVQSDTECLRSRPRAVTAQARPARQLVPDTQSTVSPLSRDHSRCTESSETTPLLSRDQGISS